MQVVAKTLDDARMTSVDLGVSKCQLEDGQLRSLRRGIKLGRRNRLGDQLGHSWLDGCHEQCKH